MTVSPTCRLAARRLKRKCVRASGSSSAAHHESGRRVPEGPGDDVREVFEGSYRIMYLVQGTRIDILAVIHARRLIAWPPDDASRS